LNTAACCLVLPMIRANNPGIDLQCPNRNPLTDDCSTNEGELAGFSQQWLATGCGVYSNWCGGADLDYSGTVNFADFAQLAICWQESL
jgi:hypothetical protein